MEFVSANPTGPLHIGHTRWAALGDAIARVLRASGADGHGRVLHQRRRRPDGRVRRTRCSPRPHGRDVARGRLPGRVHRRPRPEVLAEHPGIRELTDEAALPVIRGRRVQGAAGRDQAARSTEFGVHFDVWFSERELARRPARSSDAVDRLREQGHVFDDDGAVWLRTTDFGDDKDRVLIRAQRRAHLLRRRRRVLPEQEGPRLRREDLPPRRRPPRLRQPAQGHRGRRRRRPRGQHRGADRPAGLHQRRQAVQARRQHHRARRPASSGSARTPCGTRSPGTPPIRR